MLQRQAGQASIWLFTKLQYYEQAGVPEDGSIREEIDGSGGFEIYKEYVDRVSGDAEQRRAKRQNDRAYRELMEDAERRKFDCVLVWKYDRFARSLSILVAALQQFSALGVDFISYTQNIDTTTAMGRLFYHVIGSFAEFEREMIVERVKAGWRTRGQRERFWDARSTEARNYVFLACTKRGSAFVPLHIANIAPLREYYRFSGVSTLWKDRSRDARH